MTGKPVSLGGSLGRATATSRGVVHVALAALGTRASGPTVPPRRCRASARSARHAARFLHDAGVRVVAVADQYGAIVPTAASTLPALEHHVDAHRRRSSASTGADADRQRGRCSSSTWTCWSRRPSKECIHAGNAADVRAPVVVEGANGPTTPRRRPRSSTTRGMLVVPDILANAGGVIVSYFEWVQANQAYWWTSR